MKSLTKYRDFEKHKGITLIALIITIIVLLILVGITIGTITGDNGLIKKAEKAKENTEISNEKEVVEKAVVQAMGNNKYGNIEKEELQKELDKETGKEKTEVSEVEENFKITFKDSNRFYFVDMNGNIVENENIVENVTREGIEVGDYVNYTYDSKTTAKYTLPSTQSGYLNQTVSQTSGIKWRILNIHENGTVDLIADSASDQKISFRGALGYNNGVYLLNDMCKEFYSNSSLGITARSVDLEDIENQMNETGIEARNAYIDSGVQYGKTKTYTGSDVNYPNLYAKEKGSGIGTEEVNTNGIGGSDNGYTTPTTETSTKVYSLTVTQTAYSFSNIPASYFKDYNGNSSTVRDMLFTGTQYWLASRSVNCRTIVSFGLCSVSGVNLNGGASLIGSNGNTSSPSTYLRPIVSLGPNIQIEACEGENSSTNMHQISK